jgi:ribonucleoside-diphosphate reductase alpha chain
VFGPTNKSVFYWGLNYSKKIDNGNITMKLQQLKEKGLAPEWMQDEGFQTLQNGYLNPGETPFDMYNRVASGAADRLRRPDLKSKFFDIIWKNWLCLATPVAANMNNTKGLPISCFSVHPGDSLQSIMSKANELAMMSKHGGGVGIFLGDLRGRGSQVRGTGGISDGVISWAKIYEAVVNSVSQGFTRRGSAAGYIDVNHVDFDEFINMRRPTGDTTRRCLNLHHGVCVSDDFMNSLIDGHQGNRLKWESILLARFETGEPYLLFQDNVERQKPEAFVKNNLKISTSNICSEICLPTDPDHSFVCCLSSLNLARWNEWKDTDTVELSIYFLDAVIEEFIQKAKMIPGFEASVRFAEKSRALGLGVLGWHTLLQEKMIPFESFGAMTLNSLIFQTIREKADDASAQLAVEYGEPDWCKGLGRRNVTTMAIAPTVSNSLISGGVSAGIEPIAANLYVQNSAKGTFIRKNKTLEGFLESKGLNNDEVWRQINKDAGSVSGVNGLSRDEKDVFLTAKEINQFALIRQAAQRQKWIDQSQSLNLFFGVNSDPKYVHEVHMEAWRLGLKSLYYCRTESVLRADLASRSPEECRSCEA